MLWRSYGTVGQLSHHQVNAVFPHDNRGNSMGWSPHRVVFDHEEESSHLLPRMPGALGPIRAARGSWDSC